MTKRSKVERTAFSFQGDEGVEAHEGYLRDRLGDSVAVLAEFWLIANGEHGDVVYVVGSTRGAESGQRQPGIVEIIRHTDQSIGINAIRIDPGSRRGIGDEVRSRFDAARNPDVDTITLAWIAKLIDPSLGAKETGPAAYQEIATGGRRIHGKSSLGTRGYLVSSQ